MLVMDMINEDYFENDDRFNRLIERIKEMKEHGDSGNGFCGDYDCDNCPFQEWCEWNRGYPNEELVEDGRICNPDDAYSYMLKVLPEEYKEHKELCDEIENEMRKNEESERPEEPEDAEEVNSDIIIGPNLDPKPKFVYNILGTEWEIIFNHQRDDKKLDYCSGYCDPTTKKIVIGIFEDEILNVEDMKAYTNKIIKHELVHAFFYESGLTGREYYENELLVDWIAVQIDKMKAVMDQAKI